MSKSGPVDFVNEVKAETKKVTWPSRKETTVSVIAVFIMVTLAKIKELYYGSSLVRIARLFRV